MPLWLNEQDVQSVLTMTDAIAAVESAFRHLADNDVTMPQRLGFGVPAHGGGGAAMPAYVGGDVDSLGVKVVTLFGGNPARGLPAIVATNLLLDAQTGQLQAMMDGSYLTAIRTGAAGGVAAKYLARTDVSRIALFGAGVQARSQLEALCAVRAIEQVAVVARSSESADRFSAKMGQELGIDIRPAASAEIAVRDADVVVLATSAHEPVLDGSWLQPGVHINAIGSHAPAWRELDTISVQRATLFADQRAACLAEAGDLIIPIQAGDLDPDPIAAELGDVIAGRHVGRESAAAITLFKSVGLAIQDVAVADLVYRRAVEAGAGQTLAS